MSIVTEAQVIKVLQQYNPWWKSSDKAQAKSKLYKSAACHEAVKVMFGDKPRSFALLLGARRLGKTTILLQLKEKLLDDGVNPKNILYVSFDNPLIRMKTPEEILAIYETLHPTFGDLYLFLDELQYSKDCLKSLNMIFNNRKDVQIASAVSATPFFDDNEAAGGAEFLTSIPVSPLSFYEY